MKYSEVEHNIIESINLKNSILEDKRLIDSVCESATKIIDCYNHGNKVYFCGNGGSFADAQHLSAELNGRFKFDRPPLEVVLLASNVSYLTAVSNDYDYSEIFLREFKSSFKKGDILICFTTSGNSKNIVNLLKFAKSNQIYSICFTGLGGGLSSDLAEKLIEIPSNDTARIQECHMILGHSICQIIENQKFKK